MPPPSTMPSNLIIAAVSAFRTLVNTLQGTEDQGLQLRQTAASLGEVANVLDRLAASTAAHEQQFVAHEQHFGQMDQRLSQMSATDQQTVQQVQDLQQRMQNATSTSTSSANRKPLCESRSVANLKILGSRKEDFKNWNEKLINATTQVFGLEWRDFIGNLNECLDVDRRVLNIGEPGKVPGQRE